jgi:hypothetical protein
LPNRIPEKEIIKCFVNGLKPELFKEEMFSKSCDTLVEVMAATRADLATYRDYVASATNKNFPPKTFCGSSPVPSFYANKSAKEFS